MWLCVQPCLRVVLPPGQTLDSILTLDMQIFGPTLATFPPQSQAIITQGVASFLKSGVTASQITLTVKDLIAAVSCHLASKLLLPYHLANPDDHHRFVTAPNADAICFVAQKVCQQAGQHLCNLWPVAIIGSQPVLWWINLP